MTAEVAGDADGVPRSRDGLVRPRPGWGPKWQIQVRIVINLKTTQICLHLGNELFTRGSQF